MKKGILSKSALQYIAAAAMLAGHTAFLADSFAAAYFMTFFSRITIVIMCMFVAEGFYKTHDLNKYALRLAVCAAVSQLPYYFFRIGTLPQGVYSFLAGNYSARNVIFTLLVGLMLLSVLKSGMRYRYKLAALVCALFITRNSDWGFVGVMSIAVFGMFHGSFKKQACAFVVVLFVYFIAKHFGMTVQFALMGEIDINMLLNSVSYAGCLLALPLIALYNGKRGACPKYALYIFYPAHLAALFIIKLLLS